MNRRCAAVAALALLLATGCSSDTTVLQPSPPGSPASGAPAAPAPTTDPTDPSGRAAARSAAAPQVTTVLAVGDIARCDGRGDEATAALTTSLLRGAPGATVLALGDLAYPNGSRRDFARCYHPSWGRLTPSVRPVPGNHEYRTSGASAYFDYFGRAAGPRGKGWYSFDAGAWHVVALNSNCDVVGCGPKSAQVQWLRADLARHPNRCTLAYWHHPRFSSGRHGSDREVATLWSTLERAGADIVLSGHDHDYERFAPQRADGAASARGLRQFVVGTGGAEHRAFATRVRGSQKRITGVDAVLQLRLTPTGYRWTLLGTAGASTPLDAGAATCS